LPHLKPRADGICPGRCDLYHDRAGIHGTFLNLSGGRGGHYFALRGLGDFWGFVAGAALLLDYTIDIALFAVASAGYINFFLPSFFGVNVGQYVIALGPFHDIKIFWLIETMVLIFSLMFSISAAYAILPPERNPGGNRPDT